MTSLIRIPFADSGDKSAVPETDATGGVNMTQGYGQAYSLDPATDPSAKRIEREMMNGLFNLVTSAIGEIQVSGVTPFITSDDNGGTPYSYMKGAVTFLNGVIYQSLADSNTTTPPSSQWAELSGSGRLINLKIFKASGIYTASAGTKKIIVEVQGGGGGGGGASLTASGTAVASAAAGGTAGCYARAQLDAPSGGVPITVGSGGTGGVGNNSGGGGGLSSYGALVTAGGGYGGSNMAQDATPAIVVAAASTQPGGSVPVGGNINSSTATTQYNFGVRLSGTVANSGSGGSSSFGNGGGGSGVSNTPGGDAASYGAGGGGARSAGTAAITFNGGKGGSGVVLVWEYS
ncbi:hypothetical protein [Scandinavium goeteborgense]|uniref:glycine-rich domain-containing protein n=1 Tax=Scandinavium goeteborgense TaxID=1851514 RepID=UPI000F66C654|nr:hypothetical protein [Scandinavium goeteborgense]QKN82053.1 hypothetical protein A8O29_012440 [Scandinavium goeteborgense]